MLSLNIVLPCLTPFSKNSWYLAFFCVCCSSTRKPFCEGQGQCFHQRSSQLFPFDTRSVADSDRRNRVAVVKFQYCRVQLLIYIENCGCTMCWYFGVEKVLLNIRKLGKRLQLILISRRLQFTPVAAVLAPQGQTVYQQTTVHNCWISLIDFKLQRRS